MLHERLVVAARIAEDAAVSNISAGRKYGLVRHMRALAICDKNVIIWQA